MKNWAKVDILLTNFSYTYLKTFRGMYVGLAPHHAQSEITKHTINLGFFHNIKKKFQKKVFGKALRLHKKLSKHVGSARRALPSNAHKE